jgi:hypothetical protein
LAAALAWLGPPGSDMAAHSYQRALFLEHGFTLWNNYWYAGRYSFVTYSVLYYPLAAVIGIRLLAVATVASAAFVFAIVIGREWGRSARWSSRTFAIVCSGIVLAGAFPFALGLALALLALWALQSQSRWGFAAFAVLALAASALAFVLLAIVTVGVGLGKRIEPWRSFVPATVLATLGVGELLLWRVFPDNGRYPFSAADLIAVSLFSAAGSGLIWRLERARTLRMFLVVYGLACVGVYLVPSALGSNITRLQLFAVPIAVLIASLRAWRPLPICLAAVALAVCWNVKPLIRSYVQGAENDAATAAYWRPAIRFLRHHLTPSYRVEAVDTVGHWPAEYLPAAGIPLARGWFRQDDFPSNAIFYGGLTPKTYLTWLRGLGVRYVLLTTAQPDYSARIEALLLRSGRSGLHVVLRTPELTIYEVPGRNGILTGDARARVLSFSQAGLVLRLPHAGSYRLAARYSPYWRVSRGCIVARTDGMIEVLAPRPETISLTFHVDAARALATLAGNSARTCARGSGFRRPTTPSG